MAITPSMVKELRERTGAGMMECKKALDDAHGDMDLAIESLRKKGAAKADKKAGRIAAEGALGMFVSADQRLAGLAEVNCETDFVAKGEDLQMFARQVAQCAAEQNPADMDALLTLTPTGAAESLDARRRALVAKLGENINVRRFVRYAADGDARVSLYLHGYRIGVLVESAGGRADLGRDLAMHVAASRPLCVSGDEVPAEVVAKEKEIYRAQAAESGKPADIVEKMISGRVSKFLNEMSLLGQPFIKNPEQTVAKLLAAEKASVNRFVRYEVGEGLEKRSEDFAAEVMSQVKGG